MVLEQIAKMKAERGISLSPRRDIADMNCLNQNRKQGQPLSPRRGRAVKLL